MSTKEVKTKEEILDKLYATYGTDSGVLFGITDKSAVKEIVGFTYGWATQQTSIALEGREEKEIKVGDLFILHGQTYECEGTDGGYIWYDNGEMEYAKAEIQDCIKIWYCMDKIPLKKQCDKQCDYCKQLIKERDEAKRKLLELKHWIGVDRIGAPMRMLSFKDGIVKFDCYGVRGDEPLNKILHDEINGMEHYQHELQAELAALEGQKGPVWVKAHERFPANDSPVYVRCSHGKKILYSTELGWFDFESDKMYMCHDDKNEKTIEWLSDESPSPAQQSITSVINTSPDDIVTSDLISYWRNNPSSPQPEGEKEKFSADVLNWMIQIGIKHNLRGWYQEGIFSCDYYSTEDLLTLYKSSLEKEVKKP